jgi:hypothetical protein
MLINIADYFPRNNSLFRKYKGVVVDNADPKKLGRVKCSIQDLLVDSDSSKLPWIYPESSSFLGGKSDSSFFAVPKIGSELTIEFNNDDIYQGFYIGYWTTSANSNSGFFSDYPNEWGFVDQDFKFKHNSVSNQTTIVHPSGTTIKINPDGKIELLAAKIDIGTGASESVVLGDAFKAYFDTHVHPTAVGPSGPPNSPMPPSNLSQDIKVK